MSKNREIRQQQEAQQRRQSLIMFGVIAAIAVVIIGGAIIYTGSQGDPASPALPPVQAPVAAGKTASTSAASAASQPINAPAGGEPANADHANRAWGPANAPIKIEEFVDYQCPACGSFNKSFEAAVVDTFAKTGKVRWEIKALHFLEQGRSTESSDASKATLCGAEQGKFWQFHNALFANQVGENRGAFSKARLKELATKLGVNGDAYDACMANPKGDATVKADSDLATQYKVTQTPSFMVNGRLYAGGRNVNDFKKIFAEIAPDVRFE